MQIFSQTSQFTFAKISPSNWRVLCWRDLLNQKYQFVVIAVDPDIAWFLKLQSDRPLNAADAPAFGQFPFISVGMPASPGILPIGMPVRTIFNRTPTRNASPGITASTFAGRRLGRAVYPGKSAPVPSLRSMPHPQEKYQTPDCVHAITYHSLSVRAMAGAGSYRAIKAECVTSSSR